jgi:hypothetical protein
MPLAERVVESLSKEGAIQRAATRVNAEQASSDCQPKGVWGGRADHVAAKATDSVLRPEKALDAPGVVAAARCKGTVGNTRDPPWQPTLGKDRAHKGQTESERSQEGVRGVRSTEEGRESGGREGTLL